MDSGIIIALILGVCSVVSSIIFGYIPRSRKEKLIRLQKELLNVYNDINEFQKLEQKLSVTLNISKIVARENLNISSNAEPKRVEKRIAELENILM